MQTLTSYVSKFDNVEGAAKSIGVHWVTVYRWLRRQNYPKSLAVKNRLKTLKIDLTKM